MGSSPTGPTIGEPRNLVPPLGRYATHDSRLTTHDSLCCGTHVTAQERHPRPAVAIVADVKNVLEHLQELGASYDVIACDPELADTAAFCEEYGFSASESANAILVASKRPTGQLAMCLVLAHTRLDVNRAVRDAMGVKKLSFASAEQTMEATGMMIGGVTPFGASEEIQLLVDSRIMDQARVIVGGGSRSSKIHVDPSVFKNMSNAQIIEDLALDVA